jgi:hypothetical protein
MAALGKSRNDNGAGLPAIPPRRITLKDRIVRRNQEAVPPRQIDGVEDLRRRGQRRWPWAERRSAMAVPLSIGLLFDRLQKILTRLANRQEFAYQ